MQHPTSAQARAVAKVFYDAAAMYPESRLDMKETSVNNGHKCGSVHCHGGWYAVMRCSTDENLDYTDGADKMATDLGFDEYVDLKYWADQCPEIWGNYEGDQMFSSVYAFESDTRDGAYTLKHIADHWSEVADRLAIQEQLNVAI